MNHRWINSHGGPLIFCSMQAASGWMGITGSSVKSVKTDYERACDSFSYLNVIDSNMSKILILGDEPLASTIFHTGHDFTIARWISCESLMVSEIALNDIPIGLPEIEKSVSMHIYEDESIIFDSAAVLHESEDEMRVKINPGKYEITTELFDGGHRFKFLIHRLRME
ncbi:Imm21 family immunity protein [Verminephrobacter aporrectodeae]|nr:Imm21 family immunity protein [Verminephrobacter aporrectodeae]